MTQPDFSTLPLSASLLEVLAEIGFTSMTPIQTRSLPALLQGRDLLGQSQTGSGKTLAFGLPLLEKVRLQDRQLQALILCPTRELCAQVAREIRRAGRRLPGLQVQVLAGGQLIREQLSAMANGVHIAVATPGRLLDHLRRNSVSLGCVRQLVLDEADRMLEMGFADDLREIMALLPKKRQTMFFSATFDSTIAEMSRLYQHKPLRVEVQAASQTALSISQYFCAVATEEDKLPVLRLLLERLSPNSALVFCRFKKTAGHLAQELSRLGMGATALHGDLEQFERDRALARFRNGSCPILVATDVAARGLDIADLDLVVNYDLPGQTEMYVHRIGRTGRAGKPGLAWSLGLSREEGKLEEYEKLTGTAIERRHPDAETEGGKTPPTALATLHIWGGRRDKLRPGDILGALTGEIGLEAGQVGKIEIHDKLVYVAVSASIASAARRKLQEHGIKGRKFRVDLI